VMTFRWQQLSLGISETMQGDGLMKQKCKLSFITKTMLDEECRKICFINDISSRKFIKEAVFILFSKLIPQIRIAKASKYKNYCSVYTLYCHMSMVDDRTIYIESIM